MTPIYLVRLEKLQSGNMVDVLVAFIASAEIDAAALADTVNREIERNLAPDELIILIRRSAKTQAKKAMGDRTVSALTSRLLGRTRIVLLGYDHRGEESFRDEVVKSGIDSKIGLDEIIRRASTSLFREYGGFIEPSASYHFANPSGRHTDRFIRLSNILVRHAEISFLALALMRVLPEGVCQAYIDTPALYAVVSSLNEQWRSLKPECQLRTDNFRSYAGLENYPFTRLEESVVIISASSSGGLAEQLIKRGFPANNIVHVLFLGPNGNTLKIAVDLRQDAIKNPLGYEANREIYEAALCSMCARGSVAIPLRGDQFDIQGPQPQPLLIRQADAPRNLGSVMERLAGCRVLNVSTGTRQYHIDTERLLSAKGFQDRLDFFTRRHVPGGIEHCIVADEDSCVFAERIKKTNGSTIVVHSKDQIDEISGEPDSLRAPILVVAGAIRSGRVLLEISRDLRNVVPFAPIIYIVGAAKIESVEKREFLRRTLTQSPHHVPHLLEIVDELILPAPPTPNAWAEELGFLQETRDTWPSASTQVLQDRLDLLLRASEVLVDNLFLNSTGEGTLKLQEGFAFWPRVFSNNTQADVFYTISMILKQLRTAPPSAGGHALRTNWLQQTLLSPENFGRFNDGIIQASILRGARPAELDFRDDVAVSMDAARIVRRILEASDRPRGEAAVEFLVALATRRLCVRREHQEALLADAPHAPTLVRSFLQLARARL